MFDIQMIEAPEFLERQAKSVGDGGFSSYSFLISKRLFDICVSMLLLPVLAVVAIFLLAMNPVYNRGGLFFTQRRMGRECKPFVAWKFRSMVDTKEVKRGADSPLELDRITPLGGFLRKSRIDELPQVVNVLRGDMSLIGPRPDYYDHALEFLECVPGYRARHQIRPGISGLAQTELGYIEGVEATGRKVRADLYYISNASLRLDTWIFWRTLSVVFKRAGA